MSAMLTYIPYGTFGGPHAETLRLASSGLGPQQAVALGEDGSAARRLREAGVPVQVLHRRHLGRPGLGTANVLAVAQLPGTARRLTTAARLVGADVVRGFGLHNPEVVLLPRRLGVVWTISGTMTPPRLRHLATLLGRGRRVAWLGIRGMAGDFPAAFRDQRMTTYLPPVDDDFFTVPAAPRQRTERRIGLLAALSPVKGVDRFVASLAHLPSSVLPLTAVVAGPPVEGYGPQVRRMAARAAAHRRPGLRVVFEPWHHDARAFVDGLDALVVASNAEGFPNVVGEALARGVPVATTPVGSLRRLIEPPLGRVACSFDPDDLAAAISAVLREADAPGQRVGRRGWAAANLSTAAYAGAVRRAAAMASPP